MEIVSKLDINNRKNKVKQQIGNIIKESEKIRDIKILPHKEKMLKATDIVKQYIIENKRKVFGGMAVNEAIKKKAPKKAFYTKDVFPDYDFYSPEPVKDMIKISNLLHDAGFKDVIAKEAFHDYTYKISAELYENELADISYIWSYNYHKIPTFVVNNIHFVSPNFQIMDMYRILTNPMTGWFKVEQTYERCKLLEHFYLNKTKKELQKNVYKLSTLDKIPKYFTNLTKNIINNFIKIRNDVIIIGDLSYNHLIKISEISNMEQKLVQMNSISIYTNNYNNLRSDIIKFLSNNINKKNTTLTINEYNPFLELLGQRCQIDINGNTIISIDSTDICQPYQINDGLKYASYHLTILNLYARHFKAITMREYNKQKRYKFMIENLEYAREYYYKKNKKIGIEKTPYQELQIECMGNEIHTPFYKMVRRIQDKNRASFQYIPEKRKKTTSEIKSIKINFPNRSGNLKHAKPIKLSYNEKLKKT